MVLNRNRENLGIVPHIEKVVSLASGAFIVENDGDDVWVPQRAARMVEAWLASGRRAKAIHSARRRMDARGGLHEVFDDASVLAHQTPLEIIRDHGTMVGASLPGTARSGTSSARSRRSRSATTSRPASARR